MQPKLRDHATFSYVAQANRDRTEQWQGLHTWSPTDWALATVGELGEVCNVIKKMKRIEDGHPSKRESTMEEYREQIQKEIGDTYIYLDLLAQRLGLSMYDCVAKAFNEVSKREGYSHKLI